MKLGGKLRKCKAGQFFHLGQKHNGFLHPRDSSQEAMLSKLICLDFLKNTYNTRLVDLQFVIHSREKGDLISYGICSCHHNF